MPEEKQFEILQIILKRFQKAGILDQIMVVGSWCLYFYRIAFDDNKKLPAFRTLDVDFLIPKTKFLKKKVDISLLLKGEGFVSSFIRSTKMVHYDHPELRVEFLTPELGRGYSKVQEIKQWNVTVMPLRYLNFLLEYPRIIRYGTIQVRVPEPGAFALHKLIVSDRRIKQEKKKSDIETAIGLLNYLYEKPYEIERIKDIMKRIPKKWARTILLISEKYSPRLNEMLKAH